MSAPSADLHALHRQIEAMSPSDQLRLAAGLLERNQPDIAAVLVKRVSDELAMVKLLRGRQKSEAEQ